MAIRIGSWLALGAGLMALSSAGAAQVTSNGETLTAAARRAMQDIRDNEREAADILDKVRRGELEPEEVRRARDIVIDALPPDTPPEVIAELLGEVDIDTCYSGHLVGPAQDKNGEAEMKRLMDRYVAALQRGDGVEAGRIAQEMQQGQANMNARLGAQMDAARAADPCLVQQTAQRKKVPQPPVKKAPKDEKDEGGSSTRETLERDLAEARRDYDEAMRKRDDDPSSETLKLLAERAKKRVEDADAAYRDYLKRTSQRDYDAYVEQQNQVTIKLREHDRDGLPRQTRPHDENAPATPIQDYDGPDGNGPGIGPMVPLTPGDRARSPGGTKDGERAPPPPVQDYVGPDGNGPGDGPAVPIREPGTSGTRDESLPPSRPVPKEYQGPGG